MITKKPYGMTADGIAVAEYTLANGEKHTLTGLHIINEDRLRDLNGDALEAVHQKRLLQSVYMMLASLPNFRKLIDRKNALLGLQAGAGS